MGKGDIMEKPSLVYTVTLNPVIDRIYQVDEFRRGLHSAVIPWRFFLLKGLSVS